MSDSIRLTDICAKSTKCYNGFHSSGYNLSINVHCSAESVSQIVEFINSLQFMSIHSDGWFAVRLSMCYLSFCVVVVVFLLIVRSKLSHACEM